MYIAPGTPMSIESRAIVVGEASGEDSGNGCVSTTLFMHLFSWQTFPAAQSPSSTHSNAMHWWLMHFVPAVQAWHESPSQKHLSSVPGQLLFTTHSGTNAGFTVNKAAMLCLTSANGTPA